MRLDPALAATLATVVEEGTMDAAARRLNLTPSAVSQRVRALETRLGRVLLIRSKPVRATESGASIVRLARQVALIEHETLREFGLVDADRDGTSDAAPRTRVALAVNADSLATWILPPLARVSLARGIDFDLHREDQALTTRLLESGTVMAAVTSQERAVPGCTAHRLGTLTYRAVASSAFAARWFRHGVTAEALAAAPVVEFDRSDELQQDWLHGRGVDPDSVPRHFVPGSHDFAAAVALGLGWGMLPDAQSREGLAGGGLTLMGGPEIRVALHWQQWNLRSTLLAEIAQEVSAAAAAVLEV